jgi:hypothetical protein
MLNQAYFLYERSHDLYETRLREAQHDRLVQLALAHRANHTQPLLTRLGDWLIAGGEWLKSQAAAPAPIHLLLER